MPRAATPIDRLQPTSRYRLGDRDDPQAREAHTEQSREWRRQQAHEVWTPGRCRQVVALLAIEPDPAAVMERLGMSASELYGRMSYDEQLRETVEETLTQHCRARDYVTSTYPLGACGTATGYKYGGGRCRECRDAHRSR